MLKALKLITSAEPLLPSKIHSQVLGIRTKILLGSLFSPPETLRPKGPLGISWETRGGRVLWAAAQHMQSPQVRKEAGPCGGKRKVRLERAMITLASVSAWVSVQRTVRSH